MADGPPPDDRELRDDLVAHYQSYARSRGADPTARELEALAVHDLTLTDRVEADAKAASRKPAERGPHVEPSPAEAIAADRGYLFRKRELPSVDPKPARVAPPLLEKPRALAKRMAQMCATAPGSKGTALADRNYLYPALAKDVIQEHTDFTFRRRRYLGLNAIDRQRAFWRAIEDIADRSTGVLGPWWVR